MSSALHPKWVVLGFYQYLAKMLNDSGNNSFAGPDSGKDNYGNYFHIKKNKLLTNKNSKVLKLNFNRTVEGCKTAKN